MQTSLAPANRWSTGRRIGILFFTLYFGFLILDFTSSDELFPHFVYWLLTPYTQFWNWAVPWTGKNILHLSYPITVKPNGSGDTTYNYVLQLLWTALALIIALTWAFLDRKRNHYNGLAYWLRIVVRYYLGYMLLVYGSVKVIKLQFPAPSLIRLTETYGNSSPMGLAWTFVGYSTGYNMFIGGAEALAGILLFFKRTTLLGALISLSVMTNVFAMNMAYDIPVKIFSLNLVLLSVFIAAKDWTRIRNVFLLNHAAPPSIMPMPHPTKWKRVLQLSLKVVAIGFAFYSTFWSSWSNRTQYGDAAPKPPLYGIYDVETFVRNKDTLPPLTTDTSRWKQIVINYAQSVRITTMADSVEWMKLTVDTAKRTIVFTSWADSTINYNFSYSKPDSAHLLFAGNISKDKHLIQMKRFDETKFNLVNRGFHWINEYPFNR